MIFAVVGQGLEHGKALCFLRYVKIDGCWGKISTDTANQYLKQMHPVYMHYSSVLDANLHAVPLNNIIKHHIPKQRLSQLMQFARHDPIEEDLFQFCKLLQKNGIDLTQIGITGSILIGVHSSSSDIDLVCYNRAVFYQCRQVVRDLISKEILQGLNDVEWKESFARRACDLSITEYVWHEQRKYNKAIINGRKIDLSFVDDKKFNGQGNYQKLGMVTIRCLVIDDTYAFDYPAMYLVEHEQIVSVVSFTATYSGQATKGEVIEVSGALEQDESGVKRLVVGSNREAQGEYIKVVSAKFG
ncbi:MAG: hypothetical protein NTV43_03130 [Methylococcales bacterium]|nr:hypothetical protein [Methylococcales bacterium]